MVLRPLIEHLTLSFHHLLMLKCYLWVLCAQDKYGKVAVSGTPSGAQACGICVEPAELQLLLPEDSAVFTGFCWPKYVIHVFTCKQCAGTCGPCAYIHVSQGSDAFTCKLMCTHVPPCMFISMCAWVHDHVLKPMHMYLYKCESVCMITCAHMWIHVHSMSPLHKSIVCVGPLHIYESMCMSLCNACRSPFECMWAHVH